MSDSVKLDKWRDMPKQPKKNYVRPQKDFVNRDKVSLGIACCRFNGKNPEILLVCKRYTYAYNLFTHGKYNSNNNAELITLFNGMTVEEKIDIRSLNFMQIWYRIWLDNTSRSPNYFLAKNKFESTFVVDNGVRLKKLLAKSTHVNKIWEIPKGRKTNKTEPDIHCAIREFYEETGVLKKNYKLFPGAKRLYSYVDDGTRYTNIYYLAFTKYNIEPRIDFGMQEQVDEICDIRWMDISAIRFVDDTGRLEKFISPIFNFMKKHAKN
ncbi:mRNA-decapping protein g5R [Pacmanvirus A23]|uniref:mRNA-decapping protein g5R n=1 Tax=Pacmanvirus A23 TaxID=1932881 RepID=UPI000A092B63|nr:mRNA-decapping protein g5R [Pacmanvirus A23]QYB17656.1 mRNA-decapping protein [Pacmanvirus S19]SIP86037.1 mRNA-decapping protein g5R [Pacmanvirus A23]